MKAFEANKVTFDYFIENPQLILSDEKLVIRFEDQYYDWQSAAPFIIAMLAFKQPLPNLQPLVVVQQVKHQE